MALSEVKGGIMGLVQKSFGDFVAERYGPKWVYAQRATDRLRSQYPNSVVITPKHQKQLKVDYAKAWGLGPRV